MQGLEIWLCSKLEQNFQMFNEEKCQRKIIHTGLAKSFYFVKTKVFCVDFDYFIFLIQCI